MLLVANKAGVSLDEYKQRVAAGEKWCWSCREWKSIAEYGKDSSRYDGLASQCFGCRKSLYRRRYVPRQRPASGRRFVLPRDGDKIQARARANHLAKIGLLPKPNSVPCVDCGHVWQKGERRHEFDHAKGYDAENQEVVEVVCTKCHGNRHRLDKCKRGHEFTPENTYTKQNGTRQCRECMAIKERRRSQTEKRKAYMREYGKKRYARKQNGGSH